MTPTETPGFGHAEPTTPAPAGLTDRPWLATYGDIPADLDVPDLTLFEQVAAAAARWPDHVALTYLGRRLTYRQLLADIDRCAAALAAQGVRRGDSVTLILPNIPNVIVLLYALNRLGARVALAHPLSSPDELEHYLRQTGSRWAVTVDLFFAKVRPLLERTGATRLLVTKVSDYLPPLKRVGYRLTRGRQVPPLPANDPAVLTWSDLMATPGTAPTDRQIDPGQGGVVLFSGGTTDLPKGIELSSANFVALALAMSEITGFSAGHSVLAILPVFHGFGLGLCIHTALSVGAQAILVPEFSADIYIDNLIRHRPSFIAGVPTLFESLLRQPRFARVDFSALVGAYSGGDSLTPDLKRRFDAVLAAQGGRTELVEGYGLTECVTACVVSPARRYREGSMGVPLPGLRVKVADATSGDELPYGQEGEICITGPTLMLGYVGEPEATAETLRRHADGRLWLHSGDVGTMDADGYLYFLGRSKRIIKVSGVSVYPAQIEQVLEAHPAVARACVIGAPDDYQMATVKAFIVLADGSRGDEARRAELVAYCREHLMRWAVPRVIEFRTELPLTLVGKVAYTALEAEEFGRPEA